MTRTSFINSFSLSSIEKSLSAFNEDISTIKFETTCLYPSFEPVEINIEPTARGYRVHDGGQAYNLAWLHGKNKKHILNVISKTAFEFSLDTKNGEIYSIVENLEWMKPSILAIANCSAKALEAIISKRISFVENTMLEHLGKKVRTVEIRKRFNIELETELKGYSGKTHKFDLVLSSKNSEKSFLINSVTPHHASIAHRFTAFADIVRNGHPRDNNLAVFQDELAVNDSSLMLQVANLAPLSSISDETFSDLPQVT